MNPQRIAWEGGPGDLHLKLPCRDLGSLKYLGGLLLLGSVILLLMAKAWGWEFAVNLWEDFPDEWQAVNGIVMMRVVFLIPAVMMVVLSARLLLTGCVLLFNLTRTSLRVTRTELQVIDYWGGWKKKRSFPVQSISRLSMARGFGAKKEGAEATRRLSAALSADFWSLVLLDADNESVFLAVGYPQLVIQELSRQLTAQLPGVSTVDMYEAPEQNEGRSAIHETVGITDAPADTKVVITHNGGAIQIDVPQLGLRKGGHGLFGFGCIFSLLPSLFLGVLLYEGLGTDWTQWVPVFMVLIFLVVGVAMMAAGVAGGTREVQLTADAEGLRIVSRSLFGKKVCAWKVAEVKSLKVAKTGTTVGDVALRALYVESVEGKVSAWLKMLSRKEQEWIRALLQQAMGKS
ncbi:hypothetical protein P3T73_14905 [Kiritimatiellota bacterium B12222]|nr:hypothetical protein P3T73_14905 [Kiritimatiellota bacterium B12222]